MVFLWRYVALVRGGFILALLAGLSLSPTAQAQAPVTTHARELLNAGRFADAIIVLSVALEEYQNDVSLLVLRGQSYEASGHFGEAVRDYKRVLHQEPGHPVAVSGLERARRDDVNLGVGPGIGPDTSGIRGPSLEEAYTAGSLDLDRAILLYDQLATDHPGDPEIASLHAGLLARADQRRDEALVAHSEVVDPAQPGTALEAPDQLGPLHVQPRALPHLDVVWSGNERFRYFRISTGVRIEPVVASSPEVAFTMGYQTHFVAGTDLLVATMAEG
jgi:tetratricopeptide (TPR) repeat protein